MTEIAAQKHRQEIGVIHQVENGRREEQLPQRSLPPGAFHQPDNGPYIWNMADCDKQNCQPPATFEQGQEQIADQ